SLLLDTLAEFRLRALLVKRGPGKLSAQMRMAIAFALAEAYDGLIVIDGNGKDDHSAVPRFIELLVAGYDHVQGSRYIGGGKGINTPLSRTIGVRLLHAPLSVDGEDADQNQPSEGQPADSSDARCSGARQVQPVSPDP